MSLASQLEQLERFAAKVWRQYCHQDPLSQLSFNEYDYLKVLHYAKHPMRVTDLASEMEVTKPSATNMTKRLEKKGLVVRAACSEDARAKRIALTERALHHLNHEAKVYQTLAHQLESELDAQESEQLTQLLTKALKP